MYIYQDYDTLKKVAIVRYLDGVINVFQGNNCSEYF